MASRLPSLNLLTIFDAAARHLSFKLAADELCLSPSAVSHQIRTLEKQLNCQLFIRGNRFIELTEAGSHFHSKVIEGLGLLRGAVESLTLTEAIRPFSISAIPFVVNGFLIPNLKQFNDDNPHIHLDLLSQTQRVSVDQGQADLAIRHGKDDLSKLKYVHLSSVSIIPVCSPDYWYRYQQAQVKHRLIGLKQDPKAWQVWLNRHALTFDHHQVELSFDNYEAVKRAALEGLGLAIGYLPALSSWLQSGQLIAPFAKPVDYGDMYAVCTRQRFDEPDVQAVLGWLGDIFKVP